MAATPINAWLAAVKLSTEAVAEGVADALSEVADGDVEATSEDDGAALLDSEEEGSAELLGASEELDEDDLWVEEDELVVGSSVVDDVVGVQVVVGGV